MFTVASQDPAVRRLLAGHPRVTSFEETGGNGLRFSDGKWAREVSAADHTVPLFGLIELIDNNPLVCADIISVPSPGGTLALIALGPLAGAGLLVERPSFITNASAEQDDLDKTLASVGWTEGVDLHVEEQEFGSVLVATAMAVVPTPEELSDLIDLYSERYGRSFYVRHHPEGDWIPEIVAGSTWAAYRITIRPDQPNSLVTVRVMADRDGKCGAAQLVGAMNVMCGFEEAVEIA